MRVKFFFTGDVCIPQYKMKKNNYIKMTRILSEKETLLLSHNMPISFPFFNSKFILRKK